MAKHKDEAPNPMSVTNRDVLQRLNFLYQASVLLNSLAPPRSVPDDDEPSVSSTTPKDKDIGTEQGEDNPRSHPKTSQRKKRRRVVGFEELSRSYVETMKSVGQKTNVKMCVFIFAGSPCESLVDASSVRRDPSVKRRLCKRCSAPLIPGISATVRIRGSWSLCGGIAHCFSLISTFGTDSTSHGHLISYRCHCCQTERRIPAPPVLHLDTPVNGASAEAQPTEASTSTGSSLRSRQQKRKKRGPQPRLPPHFARDVGHIVFRGNERLDTT